MPTYANINPSPSVDGIVYASDVPLTPNEADLYNGSASDPIQVVYGQGIVAIVKLEPRGGPTLVNSYVAMQTDLGDGVWVDVAWCVFTNTQAPATFVLSGGVAGANSVTQVRQAGSWPTPQANGSNQITLGGRIRFVGKSTVGQNSSSALGLVTAVHAYIRYKVMGLR